MCEGGGGEGEGRGGEYTDPDWLLPHHHSVPPAQLASLPFFDILFFCHASLSDRIFFQNNTFLLIRARAFILEMNHAQKKFYD